MREKIKLESSAGTGHFYTTSKNKKNTPEKMTLRKFDPVARRHVEYKETKLKEPRHPRSSPDVAPVAAKKKARIARAFSLTVATALGVALEREREARQRIDTGHLGAVAPVLQAREQLLGRLGRARP